MCPCTAMRHLLLSESWPFDATLLLYKSWMSDPGAELLWIIISVSVHILTREAGRKVASNPVTPLCAEPQ